MVSPLVVAFDTKNLSCDRRGFEKTISPDLSYLPGFLSAGIGTIRTPAPTAGSAFVFAGCRGFTGPVPPPLWIRALNILLLAKIVAYRRIKCNRRSILGCFSVYWVLWIKCEALYPQHPIDGKTAGFSWRFQKLHSESAA
jgi:hypothetical protein